MTPKPAPSPEMQRRLEIMIWAAFLVAIVGYYVLMRVKRPAAPVDTMNLVLVLNGVSVVLVAASFIAKRRLKARALATGSLQTRRIAQLLPLALCDTGALCGLLAWFTTTSPLSFYPLIIGFGGVVLHFPRASDES